MAACKGIGFAIASPFWKRWLPTQQFFKPVALVTFLASLAFPLMLLAAHLHISWVYIAYLGYGIMQAGSELYWHLTGPIFSGGQHPLLKCRNHGRCGVHARCCIPCSDH